MERSMAGYKVNIVNDQHNFWGGGVTNPLGGFDPKASP